MNSVQPVRKWQSLRRGADLLWSRSVEDNTDGHQFISASTAKYESTNYEYINYEILPIILSFSAFLAQIFSLLFRCQQNPLSVFSIKARDHVQTRIEYEVKLV